MSLRQGKGPAARRGSLLVPLVAAITILGLSGIVLTQAFGAQRVQSVMAVESSRAYWIAEAGSWHASMAGIRLDPAVTFDQGSYATELVAGTTDEYVGMGLLGNASRRVALPGSLHTQSNSGGGQALTDPIDEPATNPTATRVARTRFSLLLQSARSYPSVLSGITLVTSDTSQSVEWVQYGGAQIWRRSGAAMPGIVEMDLKGTDPTLRIVEPSPALSLTFRVRPRPSGTDTYQVQLRFTDGSTSQLLFPISW